jgi:hypothetical protein
MVAGLEAVVADRIISIEKEEDSPAADEEKRRRIFLPQMNTDEHRWEKEKEVFSHRDHRVHRDLEETEEL